MSLSITKLTLLLPKAPFLPVIAVYGIAENSAEAATRRYVR